MGLFSKPEVIFLKESSDAKNYLEKLEELLPKTKDSMKEQIQKEIAITKAGIVGEDNILFELKNSGIDMIVLHDIYIQTKDGRGAQIDFIVVTSKIIFVIECKNLFGNIEIDSKGNFIRTMEYGGKKHKEGIYSPITQNERHMAILKECRLEDRNFIVGLAVSRLFDRSYKPLVVFANPKTVVNDRYAKREVKNQVIRADQLIKEMKQIISDCKELPTSKKDMMTIAQNLLSLNIEERKDYFLKYEELVKEIEIEGNANTNTSEQEMPCEDDAQNDTKEEVVVEEEKKSDVAEEKICPRCGNKLVLRTAKKGNNVGQQFWGCLSFPKCRYMENVKK